MSADINYRLATSSDAAHIAAMSRDLIEAGFQWRWRSTRVLHMISQSDVNVITARTEERLLGFAIMRYNFDDAHLLLLAVSPRYRRQGIASALVEWLEKSARVAGVAQVKLEVRERNHIARQFYQSLGYKETQIMQNYYYGREAAVTMEHDLRVSV